MTEELIFRTKVDSGKSVKETDKLKDSLKGVGTEAKGAGDKGSDALEKLNKRVEEGNFSMREAMKIVKEYGAIALQAGRESPVGQEAIKRAGELTDTIGDLRTEIVNAGTDGANLKAGLELASTVTAGYGAFQGVLALTGTQSEALTETFVKLQAVQSVLTGIEQVRASLEKESLLVTKAKVVWTKVATAAEYVYAVAVGTTTGAMKALRIAMLAIPIIAIIAGIVALIAALASFFGAEEKAEEQNKALNASFERQNEALEANSRAFKRNADNKRALMVSEGATAQELFEFDKKRLYEEEILRKKNIKLLKTILPQKTAAYKQALYEENWELAKTIAQETKQMRDKYKGFRELDGQYAVDRKLLENKYRDELAQKEQEAQKEQAQRAKEYAKKRAEQRAQEAQKQLDEQRLLEDLMVQNIEDSNLRKIAQQKLQHDRELAEVKKKYGDQAKVVMELETKQSNEKKQLLADIAKEEEDLKKEKDAKELQLAKDKAEAEARSAKAELEGKLTQARDDFEIQMELKKDLAFLEMEQALSVENITSGEKFKIQQEYLAKLDEIQQEQVDKEKERQKNLQESTKNVLQMGLDSAQGLADAVFDYRLQKAKGNEAEELKIEKRKFEINKKLQIAQAVMQGIQATLAAFSSGAAIPVVGPVAGPAFAAVAATQSALNVARIKATTFESSSSSTSTPSASAPSVDIPQIQGEQSQQTTTQTAGLTGSQQQIKVVLLDSEIKASLDGNQQVNVVSNIG